MRRCILMKNTVKWLIGLKVACSSCRSNTADNLQPAEVIGSLVLINNPITTLSTPVWYMLVILCKGIKNHHLEYSVTVKCVACLSVCSTQLTMGGVSVPWRGIMGWLQQKLIQLQDTVTRCLLFHRWWRWFYRERGFNEALCQSDTCTATGFRD